MRIAIRQAKVSVPAEAAIDGIDYVSKPSGGSVGSVYRVPITQTLGRVRVAIMQPMTPPDCDCTLRMMDSSGDGWQGAYIAVYIDGGHIADYDLFEGAESEETFSVPSGSALLLEYNSGSYENDNSYELIMDGEVVFSDGPFPATGTVYEQVCGAPPCAVADYTYTAVPMMQFDFADTSTGNPVEWYWDFGDGNHSTEQNPTHIYTAYGEYDVTLTVYDGNCPASEKTKNIPVRCYWEGLDINRWTPDYSEMWELTENYAQLRLTDGSGVGPYECTSAAAVTGDISVSITMEYLIGSGMPILESGVSFSGGGAEFFLYMTVAEEWDAGLGEWVWRLYVNFAGPTYSNWITSAAVGILDIWGSETVTNLKFQRALDVLTVQYRTSGGAWQTLSTYTSTAVPNLSTIKIYGGTYWQDTIRFSAAAFDPCPEVV